MTELVQDIEFINTNERLIFINQQNKSQSFNIEKTSLKINTTATKVHDNERVLEKFDIKGIIGTVQLVSGHYLMVFKERYEVATVVGKKIYQMKGFTIIPFIPNQQSLVNIPDQQSEEQHLDMIKWVLSSENFYFSYNYDITHTAQRIASMSEQEKKKPFHERADSRFFWNEKYIQMFTSHGGALDAWTLPITMGFVESRKLKGYNFTLISRRNLNRAGTRYYVRGIDKDGNVANNVETEQIVEISQDTFTSFVQIRGSIPLLWSQFPNLKYKPSVTFYGKDSDNSKYCETHFNQLLDKYGKVTIINLIDRKGSELKLGEAYENIVKNIKDTRYIWFDFHSICKGMRYDKLSLLMDQLKQDLESYGFFYMSQGKVVKKQTGVFRTNCIDNLDRTNVVQSLITRHSLANQITQLSIPKDTFVGSEFEHVFKNTWADHGDTISTQYSGTGALKNDFTRTGKRNFKGVLRDGENSVMRYYLNNFKDGFRQDSFYMFTSKDVNLTENKNHESKPPSPLFWVFIFIFIALLVSIFYLPNPTAHSASFLFHFVYWVSTILASMKLMMKYQNEIVDKPTLFKLESVYPAPIKSSSPSSSSKKNK
ncbi:hypothetical protein CYY_006391 [Polysphondylium violaceum]|uniref:SAC domain-containing protein n=1 Tax=Polysphondylium violaceum TaxID=133409 RepID=A0A8J4V5Z5_9MYCE|nr:hypothetical protein CYY_006391 [Polysphondylium violaceum]